ncbi:uncharacterized protein LOC124924683 [Impatiens glandulifera]|uniref:uncharacterized protein LOC124924683 n=1 Tax=Impatiens glandulifera TaxID=253017 RepID=UPI001FB1135D|nr:uncharacterized protein LOC124924683 [Impatiens glandulifera]
MSDNDDESPRHNVHIQDKFLPILNVSRLMTKALPDNATIAKDAKETVQECVSEAADKCQSEQRTTLNGDDLIWAMSCLGFEGYLDSLNVYLTRYREVDFPSVYSFDQQEVVDIFRTLEYSGLGKYLGSPFIFDDKEVREFFQTATMVDDSIVAIVNGTEISFDKASYVEFFELPSEGHTFNRHLSLEVMEEMKKVLFADGSAIHLNGSKKSP